MQLNFPSTEQDGRVQNANTPCACTALQTMSRKFEKLLPDMGQNHARKSANSAGLHLDLCPDLE